MVFFTCIVTKVGMLTEEERVRAVMSDEQRSDFIEPTTTLNLILFACSLWAIVASLAMFLLQFMLKQMQNAGQANESREQRLRRQADGAEVKAPSIPGNCFHVLLSHVRDRCSLGSVSHNV